MARKKKKEPKAKMMINKGFFETDELEQQEVPEIEKEELKAIRRYIG